jgi:hypothetical protein
MFIDLWPIIRANSNGVSNRAKRVQAVCLVSWNVQSIPQAFLAF